MKNWRLVKTITPDSNKVGTEKTDPGVPAKVVKAAKKISHELKDEVNQSGTRKFRVREFSRGCIIEEEEKVGAGKILAVDGATVIPK